MRKIRLNESQFNRIVSKCVKNVLNESPKLGSANSVAIVKAIKLINQGINILQDEENVGNLPKEVVQMLYKLESGAQPLRAYAYNNGIL